jgi:GNAT superfamily N-acetyltransferase
VQFRTGSIEDAGAVLALFDANVAWLVERGRSAQWGSEPWSENPRLVGFVRDLLSSGEVTIAEIDGDVVGASVVTDHPMPYVPALDEPERYLKLLIASPAHRGEGIGHRLVELARQRTVADGVGLLRVDCWAGGDRRLVAYYESEGFTPTQEIEVRPGTSVQVFAWRPPGSEQGASGENPPAR